MDRARILLGCVQPGQPSAAFSDALNRLCDRLHYLNSSGDKAQGSTRFWFDTRANLRREMEDRKGRFDERGEVRGKIAEAAGGARRRRSGPFEGVHAFTPHADVPDDGALRSCSCRPRRRTASRSRRSAFDEVLEVVRRQTRKQAPVSRQSASVRSGRSGLVDAPPRPACAPRSRGRPSSRTSRTGGLNIDRLQEEQAKKELGRPRGRRRRAPARECFKWLLCPMMTVATDRDA